MLPLEKIVKKISEEKGLTEEEVLRRIKGKKEELKGLVSLQGAGYVVASELGVNIPGNPKKKRLLLKNVVSGMKDAEVYGRVVRIFGPRKFKKEEREGKVATLVLSDGTGSIRLSLWNKQVEKYIESNKIKEGTKLRVKGYVKEGKLGLEIRLGKKGEIEVGPDVKLPSLRADIKKLKPKEYRKIKAAIVRLYERDPFIEVCPKCNSKLENDECERHGKVEPKPIMVVNALLDDGTGTIRAVFWRNVAERLLGVKTEKVFKEYEGEGSKLIRDKKSIEGKEFIFAGKVKFNKVTESKEIVPYKIEELDPVEETKYLLEKIKEFNN